MLIIVIGIFCLHILFNLVSLRHFLNCFRSLFLCYILWLFLHLVWLFLNCDGLIFKGGNFPLDFNFLFFRDHINDWNFLFFLLDFDLNVLINFSLSFFFLFDFLLFLLGLLELLVLLIERPAQFNLRLLFLWFFFRSLFFWESWILSRGWFFNNGFARLLDDPLLRHRFLDNTFRGIWFFGRSFGTWCWLGLFEFGSFLCFYWALGLDWLGFRFCWSFGLWLHFLFGHWGCGWASLDSARRFILGNRFAFWHSTFGLTFVQWLFRNFFDCR